MKKIIIYMGIFSMLTACFVGKNKKVENASSNTPNSSIFDISIKTLDESATLNLADYKGKYIVLVNTASACGYTPQYKDLQTFYTANVSKNIIVIGCPCNQFGGQESGTAAEIGAFCQKNYGVTFPITQKIDVKGTNQHPLYAWLTQKAKNGADDFEVKWNFNKFIINPEGKLTNYFGSGTKPTDAEFLKAVGL